MSISRLQIDQALRQVQLGLLQPDEAARWLLGDPDGFHATKAGPLANDSLATATQVGLATVSVAELQATLGPAPAEIRRDWDRQFATLAAAFEASQGRPLPDLTTCDLWVDADNRLSLASHVLSAVQRNAQAPLSAPPASTHESTPLFQERGMPARKGGSKKRRRVIRHRHFVSAFTVLGVLLAAGAALYYGTSGQRRVDALSAARHASTTAATPQPDVSIAGAAVAESGAGAGAAASSIFSPPPLPEPPLTRGPSALPEPATAIPMPSVISPSTVDFDLDATVADAATAALLPQPTMPPQAAMADADDDEVGGVDFPITKTPSATFFELPPLPSRLGPQPPEPVTVVNESIEDLTLSFPLDVGLELLRIGPQWTVQTTKGGVELAAFSLDNDGLQFQWRDQAAAHPLAKQLASGSLAFTLRSGIKRSLFLRPELSAPAWPLDLGSADNSLAWPIEVAPPANASTLTLEFQLPQEVLLSWIQPHAPKQFRRSQSIAEFALSDDPTVAIRSRLDLRTGTRISLRVRHAARLDPTAAWQMISRDHVQSAHDQVTEQLAAAMAEQSRLKGIYSYASTADRKAVGALRETVDALVDRLQRMSVRLTQYEQLIALLDGAVFLNVRLGVHWPQITPPRDQTIFATVVPTKEAP